MAYDFTRNDELSCKCYSFEIQKQRGKILLKYSAFNSEGQSVEYCGQTEVDLMDYSEDPRFLVAQELLQEIADSNNPKK